MFVAGARRLPRRVPIDLRRQLLHFLTRHGFPQQFQMLQGDDGRQVLAVATDDHRPALGGHPGEHGRILLGRLWFIHAARFLKQGWHGHDSLLQHNTAAGLVQ